MKRLLAFVLAFALPVLAADFPSGSPKFLTDFKAATEAAKKEGKPLIVVFSAVWCPPCQAMKKTVYPSKEVTPLHDKFVWAYLDTDVEANAAAAEKYGVSGIPHIQFLGADGKSLGNQVGGTSASAFAGTLENILAKAK